MFDHGTTKRWMKGIGLGLVLALVGTGSYGEETRVTKKLKVLGSAAIHGKNTAQGRQNAVNDALAAAVGQVVMEMLTGETVVRRFELINDNILAERDKYIQNYRVLTESVSGTTVRTLVQVDIAQDRVSRDLSRLGLALADAVYPRILFMLAEKNVTDAGYAYWWGDSRQRRQAICEGAMAARLQTSGFTIVDASELSAPLGLPMEASEADRMAIARRLGADVLMVGSCTAAAAPNTMEGTITAFEAVVEAQAYNVQTGRPIGRTDQKAVVSGQDAVESGGGALSGAGESAGDDMARQVMAAWQQEQDRSAVIEMFVEGTGGHIASFVRLRTAIASLSGVKELKMKEMSADRAAMAVHYQGSTRSLADAMLLKTFSGFGIDIFDVTPAAISLRLVHQ